MSKREPGVCIAGGDLIKTMIRKPVDGEYTASKYEYNTGLKIGLFLQLLER